jgi:hypothetical protein
MSYTLQIPRMNSPKDLAWLARCYVEEGQAVVPGTDIVDIVLPGGIVETLVCQNFGVIAHIETGGTLPHDSRAKAFQAGDMVCHIVDSSNDSSIRKGKGLHPTRSTKMRLKRLQMQ